MKVSPKVVSLVAGAALALAFVSNAAAENKDEVIKDVMKKYHKAPQGVDPVCKRAAMGKATKEEIKELVVAYTKMAEAKPPQGDEASWKEKNAKLLAATKALEKGDANAPELYKKASDCKACHSVHRPPQK